MRILYLGDVMGRSGRVAVIDKLQGLKIDLCIDFVIVCGENAAHGFGITPKICQEFFSSGVDVITTGNHAWDQRQILNYFPLEPRLLRPLNYSRQKPGSGSGIFKTSLGHRVAVCQISGSINMNVSEDPFESLENFFEEVKLLRDADVIVVDIHAEATSEKAAIGQVSDGRASFVVGSHTHVPTSDARILKMGTAFQTDAGMCGPYDSVIGMDSNIAINRFINRDSSERLEPAKGVASICVVVVDVAEETGLSEAIYPLRDGGNLSRAIPPSPK